MRRWGCCLDQDLWSLSWCIQVYIGSQRRRLIGRDRGEGPLQSGSTTGFRSSSSFLRQLRLLQPGEMPESTSPPFLLARLCDLTSLPQSLLCVPPGTEASESRTKAPAARGERGL